MDKDHATFRRIPLLMPLQAFCELTGLSKWDVMRLRRSGELRTFRVGKRHRYLKSEVARLAGLPL